MDNSLLQWLRVVHFLGLVLWMGGLLSLSRILGYHVTEIEVVRNRYAFIERKLLFGVTLPGALLSLVSGLWLLTGRMFYLKNAGMHFKLLFVAILVVGTIVTLFEWKKLARGVIGDSALKYKILHGVIALALILVLVGIEILAPTMV